MNVFLAGAVSGNQFNTQMKEKLGVYLYLKDAPDLDANAVALKTELESHGLKVDYTSKQDALAFVEKRVSDLTSTLKKYNLENPLPATLYVKYWDQAQFDTMKSVLETHKEHILNLNDLSENAVKNQEKRVLNIINLSNFLQSFAYLVVVLMVVTIITFTRFFLSSVFEYFKRDIQAKKLLGATVHQIAQPFLRLILMAMGMAFIIAFILLVASCIPLDMYLSVLFDFSLLNYISSVIFDVLVIGLIQLSGVMLIVMLAAYLFVCNLHKKLR